MSDPAEDAQRVVENELASKGFTGYSVNARSAGDQVVVTVFGSGNARTAEGTQEMFLQAIERAHLDGVPLEQEFVNWGLYD